MRLVNNISDIYTKEVVVAKINGSHVQIRPSDRDFKEGDKVLVADSKLQEFNDWSVITTLGHYNMGWYDVNNVSLPIDLIFKVIKQT